MSRPIAIAALVGAGVMVSLFWSQSGLADVLLAASPIVIVLLLMTLGHKSAHQAGPIGWAIGIMVGLAGFGLTTDALWVSQIKGLLISGFVLAVLWPALLLYNLVAQGGGIDALAHALEALIRDRGLLLIALAWAFSGMLEGVAGFGLPIAIVAPMLVRLNVDPVLAVAAVAIGHAWAVTFGDMGVIFQTLIGLVDMDAGQLVPTAGLLLGMACLACGFSVASVLGHRDRWLVVFSLALLMGVTQYVVAAIGLVSLAGLLAGFAGTLGAVVVSVSQHGVTKAGIAGNPDPKDVRPAWSSVMNPRLDAALASYGGLTACLALIAIVEPLRETLQRVVLRIRFPEVETTSGFVTQAGFGQIIYPLAHPGTAILLVAGISYLIYRNKGLYARGSGRKAVAATWKSALPATIGIVTMVGLSTSMEHMGMIQLLARTLGDIFDYTFPVVAPFVGILGAFATGSNNNSNVLFAQLQQTIAVLLGIAPGVLIAAQTSGGALGSMIAPAKIVVGCATVASNGKEGDVLRLTLPHSILIGLAVGLLALALSFRP